MTEKSAQTEAQAFLDENDLRADVGTRLLDLGSEFGELSKEFLRATEYGQRVFESTGAWQEELGDVYFVVLVLAVESGVDLESCLGRAIMKYARRLEGSGSIGSDAGE